MKHISILLAIILLLSIHSFAQIINVPDDQPTIQEAINASAHGDTVLVADGTYFENINFKGKAITVASHFLIDGDETHIDSTIINGSQPSDPKNGTVVNFISGEDTTSVLYGLTITGGTGSYNLNAPHPNVWGAGGIAITSGAKIIYNKIIFNSVTGTHTYAYGGGIVVDSPTQPIQIINNIIANNRAIGVSEEEGGGGGIFCVFVNHTYLSIADNIIANNSVVSTLNMAKGSGGGINYTHSSENPNIRNNLIINNSAKFGGGLKFTAYDGYTDPTLINNTIVNNYASNKGGAIYTSDPISVLNSIFWGNIDPDQNQISGEVEGLTIVEYSNVEGGFEGNGNIDLDPKFSDTVNYYLGSNSPCVDAGHPFSVFYDIEDLNNPGYSLSPALGRLRNDMGAYGGNPNMVLAELPEEIVDLKVDNDTNYIPDRLNELLTTAGVVTSINFQKSSGNLGFYIQDESSGIYVFADNDDSTNYEIGDWIEVTGTVSQYSGLTEIEIVNPEVNLILLKKNHSITAQTVYIDEILKNPENFEGMFVEIKALKKDSGDWPTTNLSTNLAITDGYKTLTFRMDDDTDLGNNPEPVYPMNLVGVVSQYTSSQPANDGYQLLINSFSDIEQNVQAAPSPYFFLTPESKANENGSYGITENEPSFVVSLNWFPAIDVNNDNLTYTVVVIRDKDGVVVEEGPSDNGGSSTRSSRTNAQIIDFIKDFGENNKFTGSWVIRVTDGNTGFIASVDTMKNFTLEDLITDVDEELSTLPTKFELNQNYPNPFNPSTTIKYSIPSSVILRAAKNLKDFSSQTPQNDNMNITLKVYDILGREVKTLVNQKQNPGNYEVTWDASNVPSGVYFYKLTSGSFVETKKMVLLR